MRAFVLSAAATLVVAAQALAATHVSAASLSPKRGAHDPWQVSWLPPPSDDTSPAVPVLALKAAAPFLEQGDAQPTHAAATVEYSDGYRTRQKIHKYTSFATLPLFATELALGQSLYNPPTDANGAVTANSGGKATAHAVVGAGIAGLFGVNTAIGAWNLFGEGWKDTNGRTLRLVHGLLMMAADVGFLATTASGPKSGGSNGALTFATDKVTHRNIAIASISVGTVGYLLMLFGNH